MKYRPMNPSVFSEIMTKNHSTRGFFCDERAVFSNDKDHVLATNS